MSRLRRTICVERLESRALLAASLGIPALVVQSTGSEPQMVASIEIENVVGLRAATVEIRYDQNVLQPDIKSVRAGSLWDGKGLAIANINEQDGTLTAFVFATQDLQLSTGTLLDIDFAFLGAATENAAAHLQIDDLRLNEGDIPVAGMTTEPVKNQRDTSPRPGRSSAADLPAEGETLPTPVAPPNKPSVPSTGEAPPPTPIPPAPPAANQPVLPRAPVASQSDTAPKPPRPPAARSGPVEPLRPVETVGAAATAGNADAADLFCTPWPSRPAPASHPVDAGTPPREPTEPSEALGAAERSVPLGPKPPGQEAVPEVDTPESLLLAAPLPSVAHIVPSESVDRGVSEVPPRRTPVADVASWHDEQVSSTPSAAPPAAGHGAPAENDSDAVFHRLAVGLDDWLI